MRKTRFWQSGIFQVEGRSITGELKLDGPKSRLVLYDSEFFNSRALEDASVHGVLSDLTKISLLDCISLSSSEHGTKTERRYDAHLFPNYAVCGNSHLSPNENAINSAEFLIGDASTLFYDFDAFGTVLNAKAHIDDLVKSNQAGRDIPTGDHPIVQYFTGKHHIVTAKTIVGEVSAFHRMRYGTGGPRGVSIKNEIWIGIKFPEEKNFHNTLDEISRLLRFLAIIIGREQNVLSLRLLRGSAPTSKNVDTVFCSHPWQRKEKSVDKPHPGDVLLDPVRESEEFERVLQNWLQCDRERFDSRMRFASCLAQGNSFDIDRTISIANAFDILPSTAVPPDVELNADLVAAKAQCRAIFKPLPPSPERSSMLNAIGRIGKSALKQKVRHRAQFIIDLIGERVPDLIMVADEAVNCRNYFVHGGETRLNYQEDYVLSAFLTESLEFIFSSSELIESGWDIKSWKENRSGFTNPIGRYLINYRPHLERLKAALTKSANKHTD